MNHLAFTHHAIVLKPQMLRYNPCHDLIFPSVVSTAGRIVDPLGRYYMYYAPHNAPGGICLAFADSLIGPWSEWDGNPIVTNAWHPHYRVGHVSSPHVLWAARESRFLLYYHGENDTTRLATSQDGIHFDYHGPVLSTQMYDRVTEASYARVFECTIPSQDNRYIMMFMGNNQGTRRIYQALSDDGRHWQPHPKPLINPPPGTEVTQVGAPWYLTYGGRHFVVFHGDKTDADLRNLTTDLYIAEVGAGFDRETHLGLFYSRQQVSEDNARVSDPCVFHEGSEAYLFTAVGGRLHQRISVALARGSSRALRVRGV